MPKSIQKATQIYTVLHAIYMHVNIYSYVFVQTGNEFILFVFYPAPQHVTPPRYKNLSVNLSFFLFTKFPPCKRK